MLQLFDGGNASVCEQGLAALFFKTKIFGLVELLMDLTACLMAARNLGSMGLGHPRRGLFWAGYPCLSRI